MKILSKKKVLCTRPFDVEQIEVQVRDRKVEHPYFRLNCRDWVNVLPVTRDGQAVLIRQPRFGSEKMVLEIPGGVVDPEETNDPTLAAARELEEETGYRSPRILSLGSLNPNPAIMTNRVHFFLALDCALVPDRKHLPDPDEDISVNLVPVADLDDLVRFGRIDHSLCALCIFLAGRHLKNLK